MFRKDPASAEILAELQELKRDLALLQGEREATRDKKKLDEDYAATKRKLTDLQIEFDREKEKWEREKREVEHLVGLQRKRSEFEKEAAEREAVLTVREENLTADKERFTEHVEFMEDRFKEELGALRGLMEKFLERMPTTKQLITVGGNGFAKEDDEALAE